MPRNWPAAPFAPPAHLRRARAGLVLAVALAASACVAMPGPSRARWGGQTLELERQCQAGSFASCGELGRYLVASGDGETDLDQGLVLLEIACGQDDLPSCIALGRRYGRAESPAAHDRGERLLTRDCDRRSGPACTGLGEVVQIAEGPRAARAIPAFRAGCELGDGMGCENLGIALRSTGGTTAMVEEAFTRACGAGRASSCHTLALEQLVVPATHDRGVQMLAENCARGFAASCWMAATLDAPLLASPPRCERAMPSAARACHLAGAIGCVIFDACRLEQPSLRDAALANLSDACQHGIPLACLYWADAQDKQPEPGLDPERVARAYAASCARDGKLSNRIGCARAAAGTLGRATSSLEADEALSLLRQECIAASGEACCALAEAYRAGSKWVTPEKERASELRARACALGAERCCAPAQAPAPAQ